MNTPITDKLNMKFHEDESASFVDSYVGMRNLARRLEQDRAALMEALESVANFIEPDWRRVSAEMRKVVETVRANFPDED